MALSPHPPRSLEADIRDRLRTLIGGGVLTRTGSERVFAGPCRHDHTCIACAGPIARGDIEFEVDGPAAVLYFHRRCADLWTSEAERTK
jgi:hypothetical protein